MMWLWIAGGVLAALVAAVAGGSETASPGPSQESSTHRDSAPPLWVEQARRNREQASQRFCERRIELTQAFFKRRGLPPFQAQDYHWRPEWAGFNDWVLGVIERRYEEECNPNLEARAELEAYQAALADIEDYLRDLKPGR